MMRHLRFWLAHVLPRTHVTEHYDDIGMQHVHVWREWGRRVWGHRHVTPAAPPH